MQQALVVSALLVGLGGAVLLCLRGQLGRTPLPRSLVHILAHSTLIVVLATLVGVGWHQQGAVVLCCVAGAWLGQSFKERSRVERATKGVSVMLSLAAGGLVLALEVWPHLARYPLH